MNKLLASFILIIAASGSALAQIGDDNYTYSNNEITLSFSTTDNGWSMENIIITHAATGKSVTGFGEWFKINRNGVDADYSGPDGWYQIEANGCDYEFNEPGDKLELSESCAGKSKTYILTLKK
jgi:hypothetical protein